MIAKDLVVLGDVRILGELYTSSQITTSDVAAYSTRMVAADATDNTDPSSEGEVVWTYE